MAVHILPYPSELEVREGARRRLAAQLTSVARTCSLPIRVELVFARSREDAYRTLLKPESLVVIGTRQRSWRTREERFARRLAARGHSVAIVGVK
jgi:hypothetical protein